MDMEELKAVAMSRRSMLRKSGLTALFLSQAAVLEQLAVKPARAATTATTFSDIQFDIGAFDQPRADRQ